MVVAIGGKSELGAIARLVTETKAPLTPLQNRLKKLSKDIGLLVAALCIGLFAVSIWQNQAPIGILMMICFRHLQR